MQNAAKNFLPADRAHLIAKDFQDFAYIVSHDLNAPLRHVKEFTRLLIGSRNNLNDAEKEYISFLERSLERLEKMQSALLTFSRLNTQLGTFRETDCNEIVSEAVRNLKETGEFRNAQVIYEDLPVVMADIQQIQLLFLHLIENGLKFQANFTTTARIEITAAKKNDGYVFEINDNGIGIDPQYHEEVFRLFRRLQPDRYSGIGAGLTFARKIVNNHGGEISIWSEGHMKGTSVVFEIPGFIT